jgi:hypothetical protein
VTATAEPSHQEQQNPLEEGLGLRRTPDPCTLVIFGASGDLTHKKLMPALYALMFRRLMPPRFAIVGVARTEGTDDSWRADMEDAVKKYARDGFRQDVWDELAPNMRYVSTDFADEGGEDRLEQMIESCEQEKDLGGNRVYYLAVPPPAFPTIVEALGKRKDRDGWTRLIVEKPFGHDLASAQALNKLLWRTSTSTRSSGSTTTSARRPSRTCWRCGSRTGSSSPSGTASSSTTCRSRSRSRSASRTAPATTSRRARSATSSRTTCSSCSR